jgi:hypothetical protein
MNEPGKTHTPGEVLEALATEIANNAIENLMLLAQQEGIAKDNTFSIPRSDNFEDFVVSAAFLRLRTHGWDVRMTDEEFTLTWGDDQWPKVPMEEALASMATLINGGHDSTPDEVLAILEGMAGD